MESSSSAICDTLEVILINTYNSNQILREQAEAALKQFIQTPGSCYHILLLVSNHTKHRDLRQAAEILLKNRLRGYWSSTDDLSTSIDEKIAFKSTLLQTLVSETDNSIKTLLAENIRTIGEFEFLDDGTTSWPEFIPTILSYIQSSDPSIMYNALLGLRKLIKRYEFRASDKRTILDTILTATFPTIQALIVGLLSNNQLEGAHILRLCFKIFWSVTVYKLPQNPVVDYPLWFNALATLLQKPLPEANEGIEPLGQPVRDEERRAWPWWKVKKWSLRVACNFIHRYGNPKQVDTEYKPFAEYFRSTAALILLGPVMYTLSLRPQGIYVTDEVNRMGISYVTTCVEFSPTYKAIKPHLDFLLFQVAYRALSLTTEERELFQNDPQEFIRKVHDPYEDMTDPRMAATSLLQMLVRYREKDVLPKFMAYLQSILVQYNSSPPESRDYLAKEAALVSIAALLRVLRKHKVYSQYLVSFVSLHVVPEFTSPVGFLRSRAFWIIDHFEESDYSDPVVLGTVVQGLLAGLTDPLLPVQSAAACSIRQLIGAKGTKDMLRPYLPQLVGHYFRIMHEVENEEVLMSLQAIVDTYGVEINPLAVEMTQHLISGFNQFQSQAGDDTDEQSIFNAIQCLDTVLSILEAVESVPETLHSLELVILPTLVSALDESSRTNEQVYEYMEQIMSITSYLTYNGDSISPPMWSICGPLLHSLSDWAADFIREISIPLHNYLSKGMPQFIQGSYNGRSWVEILLNTIKTNFEINVADNDSDEVYEPDVIVSSTLLSAFLLNAKISTPTAIDTLLPSIVNLIVTRLRTSSKSNSIKIKLLECLLACLYYNPYLTLQSIQSIGGSDATAYVFGLLFEQLKHMTRDATQRLVVVGMSSLLLLPVSELPAIISSNLNTIFVHMVREVTSIEETSAQQNQDDDGADDGGQDEDDGFEDGNDDGNNDDEDADGDFTAAGRLRRLQVPDGGFDEDEDCINVEDEEYLATLEQVAGVEGAKRSVYRNGELVGSATTGTENNDDDDDDGGDEEEEEYENDEEDEMYEVTLPVETMDMSLFLVQCLTTLGMNNPSLAVTLQQSLSAEDAARLQLIASVAATRQSESNT